MKKTKVLSIIGCIAMIGVASFQMQRERKSVDMSLLSQNIEALTADMEEVEIVCASREKKGKCWREGIELYMCNEHMYYGCVFTGSQPDYCSEPC